MSKEVRRFSYDTLIDYLESVYSIKKGEEYGSADFTFHNNVCFVPRAHGERLGAEYYRYLGNDGAGTYTVLMPQTKVKEIHAGKQFHGKGGLYALSDLLFYFEKKPIIKLVTEDCTIREFIGNSYNIGEEAQVALFMLEHLANELPEAYSSEAAAQALRRFGEESQGKVKERSLS